MENKAYRALRAFVGELPVSLAVGERVGWGGGTADYGYGCVGAGVDTGCDVGSGGCVGVQTGVVG